MVWLGKDWVSGTFSWIIITGVMEGAGGCLVHTPLTHLPVFGSKVTLNSDISMYVNLLLIFHQIFNFLFWAVPTPPNAAFQQYFPTPQIFTYTIESLLPSCLVSF